MKIVRLVALLVAFAATPGPALYAAGTTPAPATSTPAPAQAAAPAQASQPAAPSTLPAVPVPQFPAEQSKLDGWKTTLDHIEATLHARYIGDTTLNDLRDQATAAQSGVRALIAAMTPRLDAATARRKQLEPEQGVTQSDAVKLESAKAQAEVTARQGLIQQAQLINVRAQQALDSVTEHRRAIFANSVLRRSQSLINPSFWIAVAANVPAAAGRLVDLAMQWSQVLAKQPARAAAGIAIVILVLGAFFLSPGRRWLARWTTRDPAIERPGPLRRAASAMAIMLADLAIPGIAVLVLYQALMALGVLPAPVAPIIRAIFFGITFVFFFFGLTAAVLAPGRPSWRLIGLEDAAADGMIPVAVGVGLVAAISVVLDATNRAITAPIELWVASQGVVAIALALLFMAGLRVAVRAEAANEDPSAPSRRSAWRLLIPIGWVVATAAVVAPIIGYVSFGRFAAFEMLVIVTVLMSFVLLGQFADALITASFAPGGRIGRFLRQTVGLRFGAMRQIAVVLTGAVQLALIAIAAFIILTTVGIQSNDVLGSMSSAFFGFKIGNFTVSLSAILGAVAVFAIGIVATRIIQRWLEGRYLPETNLDIGLRTSIRTGIGYVGVVLAAVVAFSFAGLNLQNIAIVAGALSVGIGFGLQSIVNNFVSGLILLVERPIKVGDRIEVGARTGVVQRINVRATEIMTYDNVSVIVPNADLVSGQVVNWMHGSFSARLSVTVGTSYDTDPDKVIALLLEIVNNNPRALKNPAPFAILNNFGPDSLEFMVFFYVGNISVDGGAANEVRLEVLKRFHVEGIEIPYAQRNVRLSDLDRLEALVRDVIAARAPAGAAPPARQPASTPLPEGSEAQIKDSGDS